MRDRIVGTDEATAKALYLKDMVGLSARLDDATSALIGAVKDEVTATVDREEADASAGTRIIVGAVALVLAALLAVLITPTVVRPVREVSRRLRRVDEQDFTVLSQASTPPPAAT